MNNRQRRFADLVLEGHTQTRAYELAGYRAHGDSAAANATRLLRKAKVAAYLAERRISLQERSSVTAARVVRAYEMLAFYDPAEIACHRLIGPEDVSALPAHVRGAIVGWKWDRQGHFVPQLANKLAALYRLARHLGLFE